jgi:multidrug efflux pump subunit AcrA (membrane-fusion protein)
VKDKEDKTADGKTADGKTADDKAKDDKTKDDKTPESGKDGKPAKEGKVAVVTPVTLGTSEGEVVEVEKGLNAGDQIVIDGGDSLHDGAKVEIAPPKGQEASGASENKPQHKHKKQSE